MKLQTIVLLLTLPLASSTALAQLQKRQIIDFQCMATRKEPVTCEYQFAPGLPIVSGTLKMGYIANGDSGTCLTAILAKPPKDCVAEVYSASDIEKLLADQARQFREQQARLCQRIATNKKDCDEAFKEAD